MKLLDPVLREPEKYMSEIEGALAAMLSCIVALVNLLHPTPTPELTQTDPRG